MLKSSKLYFVSIVSTLSLLPFLIFFIFTTPCTDDIFYHNYAQNKSVWEFLLHHYSTWTGRYFSNFMMAINPYTVTSNPEWYPLMMTSLFLIFFVSLVFLLKSIIKSLKFPIAREVSLYKAAVAGGLILLALFFHKMPRVTDSFYWFAGTSSHLLPLSFIFLCIGLYFQRSSQVLCSHFSILLITIFSFFISGSNETLAVQWVFALCFIVFYQIYFFPKFDKRLLFPLVFAVLGFAILYFAPGNVVRAKELKGGHDIGLLLLKPWGLVVETSVRYLSISLLILLLWTVPLFKKINHSLSHSMKSRNSILALGLFGLGFFVLTFVPSVWTMGGLPPRRVLNNTYMMLLLYVPFLLTIMIHRLPRLERWANHFSSVAPVSLQRLVFTGCFLFLFNNFYAWKDLVNLPKFSAAMSERDQMVRTEKNVDLVLPPLNYFPTTFFYEDITVKPDDYRNLVFAEFYKLKSVRLSSDYENRD